MNPFEAISSFICLFSEYGGKWKMLHYYAKNFYNKTILSSELDGDRLQIYFINDELPPFEGAASDQQKIKVCLYLVIFRSEALKLQLFS